MIETKQVNPISSELMDEIGMTWHTDEDGTPYITNELVNVTQEEAEAYFEAANTLYDMFAEAGQYVLDNGLLSQLGISNNMTELITLSWDDDDWHLYGRFDLAGGIDGKPIKLIEFNADTPTSLFESAIIQWALLKANGLDEERQFNNIYTMIQENFKRLVTNENGLERFDEFYNGERILFSSARDLPEDEQTVRLVQAIARDAGYGTEFCYMDEVGFLEQEGVFNPGNERFDYWFKLWPWETLSEEEPDLTEILTEIARNRQALFINPAYTLMFQSKGIMRILYELFPDSPYLLETRNEPLVGKKQVIKPVFGREGANISLLEPGGDISLETDGPYGQYPVVYQAFADYPRDAEGRTYQAGVFFAWEACGLGFRRGGEVIGDTGKFVGHMMESSGPSTPSQMAF